MCTHNGAAFVERQLESIRAQSLPVDELYVFDWASTDGTARIVQSWLRERASAGMNTHFEARDVAPGAARSFLHALAHVAARSSAALVFPCDQDDEWVPDKVRAFVDLQVSANGAFDLAYSDARVICEDGARVIPTFYGAGSPYLAPGDGSDRSLLVTNPAIGMTMCLRREWLAGVVVAFESFWIMHDWALMALAWATGARVKFLPTALVDYRQHGRNTLGAPVSRSILSRAGHMRRHAGNVRRQIASLQAAAPLLGVSTAVAAELRAAQGRLRGARIAATSRLLRPHYRGLLAGTLLIF
jgi:glycosyltransferase involved in cell wall biosynthesis